MSILLVGEIVFFARRCWFCGRCGTKNHSEQEVCAGCGLPRSEADVDFEG